ncbi:MAG: hypothetical protein GYA14_17220 [Ignavibacteria bacterium]|nr:hypothetical protein [Ignavibacteria bacterium]
MRKLLLIILLISPVLILFSQESNKGLVLEIPLIKTELNQKKYSGLSKIDEINSVKYSTGINVGYSWRIPLPLNIKFEIRPGVFLSDLDLFGVNLGIYLRGNIIHPVFANLGIKTHYNFGFEDSHISWGQKSQSGFYFNPVLSLGMPITNKFSIMIGYSYYLEKNWRESWSSDYLTPNYFETTEKLKWYLFLGIEINNLL